MYSDVLVEKLAHAGHDPADVEKLRAIHEAGQRIQRLARDLVTYARPGGRRPERVDLGSVVDGGGPAREAGAQGARRGARRSGSRRPRRWREPAEPRPGGRAPRANAAQAVPRGRARSRRARRGRRGAVTLTVADDGAGMTPDVAARAFEPFFTTRAGVGIGLGLAHRAGDRRAARRQIARDRARARDHRDRRLPPHRHRAERGRREPPRPLPGDFATQRFGPRCSAERLGGLDGAPPLGRYARCLSVLGRQRQHRVALERRQHGRDRVARRVQRDPHVGAVGRDEPAAARAAARRGSPRKSVAPCARSSPSATRCDVSARRCGAARRASARAPTTRAARRPFPRSAASAFSSSAGSGAAALPFSGASGRRPRACPSRPARRPACRAGQERPAGPAALVGLRRLAEREHAAARLEPAADLLRLERRDAPASASTSAAPGGASATRGTTGACTWSRRERLARALDRERGGARRVQRSASGE